MKISTELFKDAVNKAIKGAGFNSLMPLTTMIGIKSYDAGIKLITTDMTNMIEVAIDGVAEEIDVTVDANTFSKLVAKLTSSDVEIFVQDNNLIVKANGVYKFPIITDEEGTVSFPVPETLEGESCEILLSTIMSIYNVNEKALAKTQEQPCLTGYYCGEDKTVSTDATVITFNNRALSKHTLLLSAQALNLLTLNTAEKIEMIRTDNHSLQFIGDNIRITTAELEGIEEYPIEEISAYLDEKFTSSCKVSKEILLQVLDRLSLFIEDYDKNGAYFNFGRRGLIIHSKKDSSTESINYIESKDFAEFVCLVDIPTFRQQVESIPEDTVKISYGNENALRLDCEKVVQIVALLEDEEL